MADAGCEAANGTCNAAATPPDQQAGSAAWQDLLDCPVCHDAFTDPKLLPCLHTFCRDCLANSLKQSGIGPGQAFLCPICKNQCTVPRRGVDALKTNIFLVTLQEFTDRKLCTEDQTCDGCDKGAKVARKCTECNDWLCAKCCTLHARVKLTKDHHLFTPAELLSGDCDELLKETFEPLMCSKHGEPLRLYCAQQTCQAPICTVCKTTLGHDGHVAVELDEQAALEAHAVAALTPNLEDGISAVKTRIANVLRDEKMTNHVRKRVHRAINERLEEVVETVVRQVGEYAESLHREVEVIAKKHQKTLAAQLNDSKHQLQSMLVADRLTRALLDFGRSEEMVAMAHDVRERLHAFQSVPDTQVDGWRQPRLNPTSELQREDIALLFGTLTFAGEVTRSVLVHAFSARLEDDTRTPAICDVAVSEDNELVVVDRENRTVKVFDSRGNLRRVAGKHELRSPNRIALLRRTGNLLVKDEKSLKVLGADGGVVARFAEKLQQPVGVAQTPDGDVLVTDWVTGAVHVFDELGAALRHFPCACEAAGYVAAGAGVVAVSDWKQDQVKMFARDGTFRYQYGRTGSGAGQLDHPYGVCVDRYGHVIVADTWNNRVHLVSEDGKFIRFLVTKDDGLQWPQGVALDRKGNLVVVEQHGQVKIYKYIA